MIDFFCSVRGGKRKEHISINIQSCRIMLRKYSCLVIIIQIVLLFINQSQTIQNFEFESEIGSTITLPPCFSITRSSTTKNEHTVKEIFY